MKRLSLSICLGVGGGCEHVCKHWPTFIVKGDGGGMCVFMCLCVLAWQGNYLREQRSSSNSNINSWLHGVTPTIKLDLCDVNGIILYY